MKDAAMWIARLILLSLFEIVVIYVLLIDAVLSILICFWIVIISLLFRMSSIYRQEVRVRLLEKDIFVTDYIPGFGLMMAAAILAMIKGYAIESLAFGSHAFVTFLLIKEMYKFKKVGRA